MPVSLFHNLIEACGQPGCPVCRLVEKSVQRYLDALFYESITDEDARLRLRTSHAFCKAHAWMAVDSGVGDALGVTIIYHDLLGSVLQHLPQSSSSERRPGRLFSLLNKLSNAAPPNARKTAQDLAPRADCPACQQESSTVAITLGALVQGLGDERLVRALEGSDGLCLPHLRQAIVAMQHEEGLNTLLGIQRRKLEGLRAELAEFIRKNDYRFQDEQIGTERDAWLRAIAIVVGKRPAKYQREM